MESRWSQKIEINFQGKKNYCYSNVSDPGSARTHHQQQPQTKKFDEFINKSNRATVSSSKNFQHSTLGSVGHLQLISDLI
jgi:hypothetical protein